MVNIILKNFKKPDDIRNFDKGKFEIVKLADMTIGKATYEPGWKWSIDISPYKCRMWNLFFIPWEWKIEQRGTW